MHRILFYGLFAGSKNPYSLDRYSVDALSGLSESPNVHILFLTANPGHWQHLPPSVSVVPVPHWLQPKWGLHGLVRTIWASLVIPYLMIRYQAVAFYSPVAEGPLLKFGRYWSIMTVHDAIPAIDRPHSLSGFYYRRILPIIIRGCQRITTVSESSWRQLDTVYGQKVSARTHVVPYGINLEEFARTDNTSHENYALYVGNFLNYKNVTTLIKAVALWDSLISLKIVGSQSEWHRSGLSQLAKTLGVDGRIEIVENVDHSRLVGLYGQAIALLHLSKYEGFGLTLVEAMASGCPVVYANRSAMPEIVAKAGIAVQGDNPREVADAIERLKDGSVRQHYIQCGHERSQQWSIQTFKHHIATVILQSIS